MKLSSSHCKPAATRRNLIIKNRFHKGCCTSGYLCSPSKCTAGDTQKELEESPYLEKLLARDYEVIYLTDSVDEYMMQHLDNFEDIQFQNAVKEKLTLGGNDDKEKKKEKALRVRLQTLCSFSTFTGSYIPFVNWHEHSLSSLHRRD